MPLLQGEMPHILLNVKISLIRVEMPPRTTEGENASLEIETASSQSENTSPQRGNASLWLTTIAHNVYGAKLILGSLPQRPSSKCAGERHFAWRSILPLQHRMSKQNSRFRVQKSVILVTFLFVQTEQLQSIICALCGDDQSWPDF